MFFKKENHVLGLDIGSSFIKAAEISLKNKKLQLVSLGQIATPRQAIFGGEILNVDKLSQAIQLLTRKLKVKTKNVASGLWGTSVIVKKVSIPKTDVNLIGEQIKWVAEQYVPYDLNEIKLDYKVLKGKAAPDTMNILLVAATQKIIFGFVECIASSGLDCKILDVEGCALANCFGLNYGAIFSQMRNDSGGKKEVKKSGFSIGILDVGANTTNFVVLEDKEVVFCRDVPVGGVTYVNELQKNLGVNIHEAESLKLNVVSGKEVPEEASSVIQSSHDIIMNEIKSNVDFFLNTSEVDTLDDFYVTGGCVKIPGLFAMMKQSFNCKKLDPFRAIEIDQRKFSPEFIEQMSDFSAVSIGLSLRDD